MNQGTWKAVMLGATLAALIATQAGCTAPTSRTVGPEEGDRTISVSGSGTVSGNPDRVLVRLGVETTAGTANRALSQNSAQMQAVIDGLTGLGLPSENVQTQTVQVRPQYETPEREPGQASQQQLVGYLARNVVTVRSEELDQIGDLLDTAVRAGANRVEGISFEVSDAESLLAEARDLAWQDAEAKATQLAGLAGADLGDVISVSESTRGPRTVALEAAVEREAVVPIEPGAEQLEIDLQVVWAISQ